MRLPRGLAAGLLTALAGVVLGKLVLSGAHTAYVRPSMGPYLLASAALLAAAGLWTTARALSARPPTPDHDHDHENGRLGITPVSLLLVVPLLLAYLVGHPGLNAATADTEGISAAPPQVQAQPQGRSTSYAPLQTGPDGTARLSLLETIQRGLSNDGETLRGHRIRVQGFLTKPQGEPGTATLSRYVISCCAADAFLASVDLSWPQSPPPKPSTGQWYEVIAEFTSVDHSPADPAQPRVHLTVVPGGDLKIPDPADPYET
ncbi:TIGR03943 family protein [Solihabitans fulvus]|uniref:TIGR03943 family protein n=1 Tax=Solihabitans fulvus TaxID=1892852 RepID=A0A5B2XWY8_9PSEU|nr:TIGR03943 family protein [Solihabitans fulvus]KAA2267181.1 TIGR03943 family protein [Solihabitans fulvus]